MATLHELRARIKPLSQGGKEKLFYAAVILLVALFAFGLGRLSAFYGQALGGGQGSGFGIQYTDSQ
jgi:hypothetical protein